MTHALEATLSGMADAGSWLLYVAAAGCVIGLLWWGRQWWKQFKREVQL